MTKATAIETNRESSAATANTRVAESKHTSHPSAPGGAQVGQWFRRFSHAASHYLGSPIAFALALLLVVVWAAAGPFYDYSDSWGLVINTLTTIITFLMVFLIQNTQNRDALAIQLKLDELLRALHGARNSLVDLESLSDEQMEHLKNEFARLAHQRGND
jgi:low affinity Fe/Cu permease